MIKSMNAAWWVKRWAELCPEKPAIHYKELRITYARLHRQVELTARWLHRIGVGPGDRVAGMLRNCPEFIELFLASTRTGSVFVPLNFRLAAGELAYMLSHCRPALFAYSPEFAGVAEQALAGREHGEMISVCVEPGHGLQPGAAAEAPESALDNGVPGDAIDPESPHVIMYTSGTSGRPKGAMLSHRKTFFNCLNAGIFLNLCADDVVLIALPLFHSGGLFVLASPCLFTGATQIIEPRFDAHRTCRLIQESSVNVFVGVPAVYRAILDVLPEYPQVAAGLKVAAIGGERVPPELVARCRDHGLPMRQIMGQTETSILLWASEKDLSERRGTVGRPVFHAEVRLVNEADQPVHPGRPGEIVVRGPTLMNGYWKAPDATALTIRNGWLHTGDVAVRDQDGYFFIVDRAKDMYISGGENVYPAEIERVLTEHPAIREAAVIGVPHERWGETGHALIIPVPGSTVTEADVAEWCRARLASYKCPNSISFCDDFPRTSLGKPRKALLREWWLHGETRDNPEEEGW